MNALAIEKNNVPTHTTRDCSPIYQPFHTRAMASQQNFGATLGMLVLGLLQRNQCIEVVVWNQLNVLILTK